MLLHASHAAAATVLLCWACGSPGDGGGHELPASDSFEVFADPGLPAQDAADDVLADDTPGPIPDAQPDTMADAGEDSFQGPDLLGPDLASPDLAAPQDVATDIPVDTAPPDPGDGSWESPLWFEVPATLIGDTSASTVSVADAYSPCAPGTSEAGPEVVYTFIAPASGVFTATVDDVPADAVDVDLQLLTAADPATCVARDNVALNHIVDEGVQYWLVADTWFNGTSALAGPYVITAELSVFGDGCPADMVDLGVACMDRYEAPNQAGELPLVMYHFYEAEDWCASRGKRLCYDDEWLLACEGPAKTAYPYGDTHQPGVCRDDATWLTYDQTLLSGWPSSASSPDIESLAELLAAASAVSPTAAAAADHVQWLYQGEGGGDNAGCGGAFGVFDLSGNVEEWTRRADGGDGPDFSGNLKGRYWAEPRTCQQGVKTHGNAFRFYEIGFRCCMDVAP